VGLPAHRCAGGENRRSSEERSGATVGRAGRVAVERHSARWLEWQKLASGAKIGQRLSAVRRSAGCGSRRSFAGHRHTFCQKQQSGWRFGQRHRASGAAGNLHQWAAQGNLTSQLTRIGKRGFIGVG